MTIFLFSLFLWRHDNKRFNGNTNGSLRTESSHIVSTKISQQKQKRLGEKNSWSVFHLEPEWLQLRLLPLTQGPHWHTRLIGGLQENWRRIFIFQRTVISAHFFAGEAAGEEIARRVPSSLCTRGRAAAGRPARAPKQRARSVGHLPAGAQKVRRAEKMWGLP